MGRRMHLLLHVEGPQGDEMLLGEGHVEGGPWLLRTEVEVTLVLGGAGGDDQMEVHLREVTCV